MGAAQSFAELAWALEGPLTVVAPVAAVLLAVRFLPLGLHRLIARGSGWALGATRLGMLAGLAMVALVLAGPASSDITGRYNLLYGGLACACLLALSFGPRTLGIHFRTHVAEQGNRAAGLVVAAFAAGTGAAFAGGLAGEDRSGYGGWHVVLAFFALAYLELRANLKLVDRLGDLEDEARGERDLSAGVLLAGVALASGIVSGRAAAGDFVTWRSGLLDYLRLLWPMVFIPLLGVVLGRLSSGTPHALRTRLLTALLLVAGASAYAAWTWVHR